MPSEDEIAARVATLLSTVMNLTVLFQDEPAVQATDPVDLRSELLGVADEMDWLRAILAHKVTAGISWPADAEDRIKRLRTVADAWDPVAPPPAAVRDAARDCLGILQPST